MLGGDKSLLSDYAGLTLEDRRKRFYEETSSENCEENNYCMLGTEDRFLFS